MRKFTFCVTAALTALAIIPSSNVRAEITKQKELGIAFGGTKDSVEVVLQKGTYSFAGDYSAEGSALKVYNGNSDITAGTTLKGQTIVKFVWTLEKPNAIETTLVNKVTISTKDDETIKANYTQELAIQSNKAGSYSDKDETLQKLALETSKIQVLVNNLTWAQFEEYATTGKVASLESSIEELGNQIADAVANYEAYQTALGKYTSMKSKLDDLTATYNSAGEVTKEKAKSLYETQVQSVASYKTDAENSYKASEVTVAGKSNYETTLATNASSIENSIAEAKKAITSGSSNALSYANVVSEIGNANNLYNYYANELYKKLLAQDDGDIYNDIYVASLTSLNKSLRKINKVDEENQAKYDAGQANDTTKTDFSNRLKAAVDEMPGVFNHFVDSAKILRSNYAVAIADVNNIETKIKSDIEDVYGSRKTIKKFYATELGKINDKIKALQANVDNANASHTIKGAAPFCDNYNEDKKAILSDIAKMKEKIGYSVAEYDADDKTAKEIKALQKRFDDKKTAVAKLKSTDTLYTGKDRYPATEKAIQDSINVLTAKREAAYPSVSDKKLDAAQKYYAALSTSKIDDAIVAYGSDAETALGAYNTVATALSDFDKNIKALKAKVKNDMVTVDGTFSGKSYKDSIGVLDAFIAKVNTELSTALTMYDADHVKALGKIDAKASTTNAQILALTGNYSANETAWNKAQLAENKKRLLDEAKRLIKGLELPDEFKAEEYGLASTVLGDTLTAIKGDLAVQQGKVETAEAYSEDKTAEAIALLAEIATAIDKLSTRAAAMNTNAAKAKAKFTAETNAKNGIKAITDEYSVKLNGGTYNKVEYKGVAASYVYTGDPRISFEKDIATVNNDITTLNNDLVVAMDNEVVSEKLADEVKDGKVTMPGFTTRANKIKADVDQLLAYAEAETKNFNANKDFIDALTAAKVDELIDTAYTNIKNVARGAGLEYFLGDKGLAGYQKEYDKIKKAKDDAYNAKIKDKKFTDTSKNMTASIDGLKSRLTKVADNINGLKALAEANEKEYKNQIAEYNKTDKAWTALFNEITSVETAQEFHDSVIADMAQLQKDLVKYNSDVEVAFAGGKSDTDKANLEAALTAINNSIKTINDGWKDKYAAAIAVDNQERKERFDAAYKTLSDTYSTEIQLVEKMRKLSYASLQTVLLNEITGSDGLFSYAEKIRKLNGDAGDDFNATVAPVLFDAEETWKATAEQYKSEIEALVKKFTDAVNSIAQTTYDKELANAQKKVDEAVDALKSVLQESDKDANKAVATLQRYIDDAKKDALEQDFAYRLDETILPNFTKIDNDIKNVKETEAAKVWQTKMSNASKLASEEKEEMAKFIDLEGKLGTSLNNYNYDEWLDAAAKAWNSNKKFINFTKAYYQGLKQFEDAQTTRKINKRDVTHTAVYWTAYDINAEYHANDYAYASMLDTLAVAKADFAALEEYSNSFYAKNEIDLSAIANNIAAREAEAKDEFDNNHAVAALAGFKAKVYGIIVAIEAKYPDVIEAENGAVGSAILQLNYDYDKATAADLENASLDAYKKVIAGYQKEKDSIYDAYVNGKKDPKGNYIKDEKKNNIKATLAETQTSFLALEKKIGVTKSELTAIYAPAASQKIKEKYEYGIAAINGDYEDFEDQLAECHEPVIDQFTADVEAIKAAADAAKAEFDQMAADNTLVLYEEIIDAKIASIKDSYKSLKNSISTKEEPYDTNDSQYKKLLNKIKGYEDRMDAVTDLSQYKFVNTYDVPVYYRWNLDPKTNLYQDSVLVHNEIEDTVARYKANYLNPAKEDLEARYHAENIADALKSSSDLKYASKIQYCAADVELKAKSYNIKQSFINEKYKDHSELDCIDLTSVLNSGAKVGKIKLIRRTIESNVYDDGVPEALEAMLLGVADTIKKVSDYADHIMEGATWDNVSGIFKSTVSYDSYGNKFKNDKGEEIEPKTFVTFKEYTNLLELIAKIDARLDEIAELAQSTKGDANGDGQIDIEDVQEMVALVFAENPTPAQIEAADMNNDGVIDAADVVMLVNVYVYGNKYGNGASYAPFRYINVDENLLLSSDGRQISVAFDNAYSYSAIQMDITLPEGASIENIVLGERVANHMIEARHLSNGAYRVVIFSVSADAFAGKSGNLFSMDVDSPTGGSVQIDNVISVRLNGDSKSLSSSVINIPGTTAVSAVNTAETDSEIYSVDGIQTNELGNGINIIRSESGAVKKVLVK